MNHPNNIFPGDLVFVRCHDWDVWFNKSDIGRVYEEDQVPEDTPVIVLNKRYRMAGELIPRHTPVFEVAAGNKIFWMVSK